MSAAKSRPSTKIIAAVLLEEIQKTVTIETTRAGLTDALLVLVGVHGAVTIRSVVRAV